MQYYLTSQMMLVVKIPPSNAGDVRDTSSIPGSGRPPRGGHGNPLQYSCLENPMDRGVWWAIVHGVANSGNNCRNLVGTQYYLGLSTLLQMAFSVLWLSGIPLFIGTTSS